MTKHSPPFRLPQSCCGCKNSKAAARRSIREKSESDDLPPVEKKRLLDVEHLRQNRLQSQPSSIRNINPGKPMHPVNPFRSPKTAGPDGPMALRRLLRGIPILIPLTCCLLLCSPVQGPARAGEPVLSLEAPKHVPVGQPFEVAITSELDFETLELTWQGRTIVLPRTGRSSGFSTSLLLGSDVKLDRPGPRELSVTGIKDQQTASATHVLTLDKADYPIQRLTLPKHQVNLSQQALLRHRQEKEQVQDCLRTFTPDRLWVCPFVRPAQGELSSEYGLQRLINGQPRSPHRGLDYRTGAKAPVQAVNSGTVILTGNHFFAGNSIYIDHGQGVISMYFHLSSIKVSTGQTVSRGQTIGLTGSTGRATGPHLHFGISLLGHLVDPVPLLGNELCAPGPTAKKSPAS